MNPLTWCRAACKGARTIPSTLKRGPPIRRAASATESPRAWSDERDLAFLPARTAAAANGVGGGVRAVDSARRLAVLALAAETTTS